MRNRSRLMPVKVHARSFNIKRSIKSGETIDAKDRDFHTRGAKPDDGGTLVNRRCPDHQKRSNVHRGGEAALHRDRVRNKNPRVNGESTCNAETGPSAVRE